MQIADDMLFDTHKFTIYPFIQDGTIAIWSLSLNGPLMKFTVARLTKHRTEANHKQDVQESTKRIKENAVN